MISFILDFFKKIFNMNGDKMTIQFKSKNFSLNEFTKSDTAARFGIDNTPTEEVIENLNWLCLKILDPLRDSLNKKITVTSGFRCLPLNKKIGSGDGSQHTKGQACDFNVEGMKPKQVFDYIIKETKLPFDQVIMEFGQWIHISYDRNKEKQRGSKLIARNENGKTIYIEYKEPNK